MDAIPLFHSQPIRKAGRPKGAKAKVVQDMRSLGVHHFAFCLLYTSDAADE